MGGEPEWIAEESRPLYHAGLAIGANHLVTLVTQSMDLLRASGVQAPDRMLGPLLGAALDNALRSGDSALTGPVTRGDAGTVAAHVTELRKHAPQAVAGYLAMARATADRALAHGLLKPELAKDPPRRPRGRRAQGRDRPAGGGTTRRPAARDRTTRAPATADRTTRDRTTRGRAHDPRDPGGSRDT